MSPGRLEACGLSDVGRARAHNEDSFASVPELGLFIVADGLGGHRHGELASGLAVESIRRAVEAAHAGRAGRAGSITHAQALREAVEGAHAEVLEAIEQDSSLVGMGTTVVALWVCGGTAAIAHVGDSRAYCLRRGKLEQLTDDHSWVHEQVVEGHLSEAQAREHPLRNVVTQALGGYDPVTVAVVEQEARPGDVFLLCSDGLTSMLDDAEIAACTNGEGSLEELGQELVRRANERGGLDNITVVLIRIQDV
ncbi:MAG: Stp1/IreP family PP2C-type Ser/Thr phosphatase [Thermoanaerobaculia bacterium]